MEFFATIQNRYSVRAYQPREVPEDVLQAILQAANEAPSAGNLQPYEIVVVRTAAAKQRLADCCFHQQFIATAPLVLVFFADPARSAVKYGQLGASLLCVQDATIACAHAHLAATALGLGSCWIGAFDEAVVHEVTGAPAAWRTMALLPLGYPADSPQPRQRRSLAELVRYERVGG
jgi:nitroreductase